MDDEELDALVPAELRDILDKFDSDCGALVAPYRTKVFQAAPSETIYHYTNGDGLSGILQSGRLWLSDIFDLNDPSELRYGIKYALEALDSMSDDPRVKAFAKKFREFVDEGVQAAAHIFVSSFSCNGDELGQWRAYGDDGQGFALGFDCASLTKVFESSAESIGGAWGSFRLNYEGAELQKVQYDVAKLVPEALEAFRGKQLPREQWAAYMTKLSSLFSLAVIEAAMLSKHNGYRQEEEYRLSTVFKIGRKEDVLYRRRPYSLVKYIEFDWKQRAAKSLREVVIGPSADRETARQFVKACLTAYQPNAESVAIRYSEIPYKSVRLQR